MITNNQIQIYYDKCNIITKLVHDNIVIITGKINNLICIDIDNDEMFYFLKINYPNFIKTEIEKTDRGYHLFYKYDPDFENIIHLHNLPIDIYTDRKVIIIKHLLNLRALPKIDKSFKQWILS